MAKDKRGLARFDRRVRLLRPEEVELGPDNPYNQKDVKYTPAYEYYPASRKDSITEIDEKDSANLVNSVSQVEWELVFTPGLPVKSSWRIEDMYDGRVYEVNSPMTENGRGLSYRVITIIVE